MRKFYFLAMICLSVFALTNCGKKEENKNFDDGRTTDLKVSVLYGLSTKKALFNTDNFKEAPDIEVSLFKSLEDLKAQKNKVATQKTNKEGVAEFKNLAEGTYYVLAENSTCLTNLSELGLTYAPRFKNEKLYKVNVEKNYVGNSITTFVEQTSAVDFNNYLGRPIYIRFSVLEEKKLLANNSSITVLFTPSYGSTHDTYLNHRIELFNTADDNSLFKTLNITAKPSCDVLPVDIRD